MSNREQSGGLGKYLLGGLLGVIIAFLVTPKRVKQLREALLPDLDRPLQPVPPARPGPSFAEAPARALDATREAVRPEAAPSSPLTLVPEEPPAVEEHPAPRLVPASDEAPVVTEEMLVAEAPSAAEEPPPVEPAVTEEAPREPLPATEEELLEEAIEQESLDEATEEELLEEAIEEAPIEAAPSGAAYEAEAEVAAQEPAPLELVVAEGAGEVVEEAEAETEEERSDVAFIVLDEAPSEQFEEEAVWITPALSEPELVDEPEPAAAEPTWARPEEASTPPPPSAPTFAPADLKARIEETRRRIQRELDQPFGRESATEGEEPAAGHSGPEADQAEAADAGAGMPPSSLDDTGAFDQDAMRRRIEETRNRLKAKAFDAMMGGETSLLGRDRDETKNLSTFVEVDSDVDETIESTLTEEDF